MRAWKGGTPFAFEALCLLVSRMQMQGLCAGERGSGGLGAPETRGKDGVSIGKRQGAARRMQ